MINKTCLFTTDIHGTISTKSTIDNQRLPYGLSRFSTYLKQVKKESEVLLVDNGDNLQGSPLLTFSHLKEITPNPLSDVMNVLGYDFENVGNHDFNYGEERLLNHIKSLTAATLTSNVLYKGIPIGSSQIFSFEDNTHIGLVGVVTDYIPHWEKEVNIKNFSFLDPLEVVKKEVCELKENVDYVFVIYHGGLERDPKTAEATENLTGENIGYEFTKIDCVDAVISGHQHRSLNCIINGKIFMQCALNAAEAMRIDIHEDGLRADLISMTQFEDDPEIEAMCEVYEKDINIWLDEPLGNFEKGDCLIKDSFEARLHKHPMVSFLNQVQLQYTQAQISATALFNQPLGFPHEIRMRDIVNNYIYPNSLVVKEMSGLNLKAYLERNAAYFVLQNNEIAVNPLYSEPKPQHFNYDMLDGIDYTYDISQEVGQRVVKLTYQGKPIAVTDRFSVVMNNYRASGGGNFEMIPECLTLAEYPIDMSEIIAEYVKKNSPIIIDHKDNITLIK